MIIIIGSDHASLNASILIFSWFHVLIIRSLCRIRLALLGIILLTLDLLLGRVLIN
jgi:hypothetical protein